jgi:hypothetical protein
MLFRSAPGSAIRAPGDPGIARGRLISFDRPASVLGPAKAGRCSTAGDVTALATGRCRSVRGPQVWRAALARSGAQWPRRPGVRRHGDSMPAPRRVRMDALDRRRPAAKWPRDPLRRRASSATRSGVMNKPRFSAAAPRRPRPPTSTSPGRCWPRRDRGAAPGAGGGRRPRRPLDGVGFASPMCGRRAPLARRQDTRGEPDFRYLAATLPGCRAEVWPTAGLGVVRRWREVLAVRGILGSSARPHRASMRQRRRNCPCAPH